MSNAIEYFRLNRPESQRLLASADDAAPYVVEPRPCPIHAEHSRRRRVSDLALEVRHNNFDEWMIWSWLGERVVHVKLIEEFTNRGFSGYRLRPATVRFRDGRLSTDYSELIVVGWAGIARSESGIRLIERCPGCLHAEYSPLQNADQLIDWRQWRGEDFFVVWPLPMFTLITKRVADALKSLRVKSYSLGTLRSVEQRNSPIPDPGIAGFTVGPLSDTMPEDLAMKYGRPLGLE